MKLVEVSENGRRGWNKVDCTCTGGYVGKPVNELARTPRIVTTTTSS